MRLWKLRVLGKGRPAAKPKAKQMAAVRRIGRRGGILRLCFGVFSEAPVELLGASMSELRRE